MDLKEKRVLVTGAGGFIGSHLVETLVQLGADVTSFVRYNSRSDFGFLEMLPNEIQNDLKIIQGDLRDCDAVRACVKDVDVVFHLGALIAIPYSYLRPREAVETNIIGTLNILTAAVEFGTEKIIHTSTSEVYGTAKYVPIDEKHPLQGQSPYSASKIGADKLAESFYSSYELPVATIRPFNTYGPRQSARAIIPTIISQALTNQKIKLGTTTTTRDFTFVEDTVRAFICTATSGKSIGEVINIGSNFEISIKELVKKIASLIDRPIEIMLDEERTRPDKSEVDQLWVDNRKAKEVLDWEPKINLDEGLEKTISWIQEHSSMYKTDRYII